MTTREEDKIREGIVAHYTDMAYAINGFTAVRTLPENAPADVYDKEAWAKKQEIAGQDVVLINSKGEMWVVDEKARTSMQNAYQDGKTFAFEISTRNNKNANGWLYDNTKINDKIFIINPQFDKTWRHISAFEIIALDKHVIRDYFKDAGFPDQHSALEYLDKNGEWSYDGKQRAKVNEDITITYSGDLKEQPTNFVVNIDVLRDLSRNKGLIIDIPNTDKLRVQYEYLEFANSQKNENNKEESRYSEGFYFDNSQKDILKKNEKNIPALRGKALQNFAVSENQEILPLGEKTTLKAIASATISNDSIIFKAMINNDAQNIAYIVAGKEQMKLDFSSLNFKNLSPKAQFTLTAKTAHMEKDGTIIKSEQKEETKNIERNSASEIDKSGLGNMSIDDFYNDPANALKSSNNSEFDAFSK